MRCCSINDFKDTASMARSRTFASTRTATDRSYCVLLFECPKIRFSKLQQSSYSIKSSFYPCWISFLQVVPLMFHLRPCMPSMEVICISQRTPANFLYSTSDTRFGRWRTHNLARCTRIYRVRCLACPPNSPDRPQIRARLPLAARSTWSS